MGSAGLTGTRSRPNPPSLAVIYSSWLRPQAKRATRGLRLTGPVLRNLGRPLADNGRRDRARALADIVRAVAGTDIDRAARLTADAERIARSITHEGEKASALAGVARAMAAAHPDRAVEIAQSITSEKDKGSALAGVASAMAVADPDRAERIAQSITDGRAKARAFADIASMVAATDRIA